MPRAKSTKSPSAAPESKPYSKTKPAPKKKSKNPTNKKQGAWSSDELKALYDVMCPKRVSLRRLACPRADPFGWSGPAVPRSSSSDRPRSSFLVWPLFEGVLRGENSQCPWARPKGSRSVRGEPDETCCKCCDIADPRPASSGTRSRAPSPAATQSRVTTR